VVLQFPEFPVSRFSCLWNHVNSDDPSSAWFDTRCSMTFHCQNQPHTRDLPFSATTQIHDLPASRYRLSEAGPGSMTSATRALIVRPRDEFAASSKVGNEPGKR
jgi:hypothetical protein